MLRREAIEQHGELALVFRTFPTCPRGRGSHPAPPPRWKGLERPVRAASTPPRSSFSACRPSRRPTQRPRFGGDDVGAEGGRDLQASANVLDVGASLLGSGATRFRYPPSAGMARPRSSKLAPGVGAAGVVKAPSKSGPMSCTDPMPSRSNSSASRSHSPCRTRSRMRRDVASEASRRARRTPSA